IDYTSASSLQTRSGTAVCRLDLRQRLLPEHGIELGSRHQLVQVDRLIGRMRDLGVARTEQDGRHTPLREEAAIAGLLVSDRLRLEFQRAGYILGGAHQRRIQWRLDRWTTLDHFDIRLELRILRAQVGHDAVDLRHRLLDILIWERAAIDGRLTPVGDDVGGHAAADRPDVDRGWWDQRMREQPQSRPDAILDGLQDPRSEEHTSELQSPCNLVCRLLLEKKKK